MNSKKQIVIDANTVTRPAGRWTKQVHGFLMSLRENGFKIAPMPISIDNNKNIEVVSYIEGDVINCPLTKNAASLDSLKSCALLLRKYHDASAPYALSGK